MDTQLNMKLYRMIGWLYAKLFPPTKSDDLYSYYSLKILVQTRNKNESVVSIEENNIRYSNVKFRYEMKLKRFSWTPVSSDSLGLLYEKIEKQEKEVVVVIEKKLFYSVLTVLN